MQQKLYNLIKKFALVIADILVVLVAGILVYGNVFTKSVDTLPFWIWALCNALVVVCLFAILGLYNIVFSTFSWSEVVKIAFAVVGLTVANFVFVLITKGKYFSLGQIFGFAGILFCATTFTRCTKRFLLYIKNLFSHKDCTRVMIIGGGEAGSDLIKEMHTSDKIHYRPVCVIDDDPNKKGSRLHGVRIANDTTRIVETAEKYKVEEIFVCIPSAPKSRIREIVKTAQETKLPVKILPGIYQLATGQVTVSNLREVDMQDLLGRDQVEVNLDEIMGYIEAKTVLVTGGGGSIGSELCRQIASHNPKKLIILDIYENNAYEIEQELKRRHKDLDLLTLIASIRDQVKMRDVFEKYRPQIVFHAAAHKHVPLMETSPNEAVKNNVFGTLNVARCADEFKVETFVQISTDKAVNPTNVMGASKRICEMIIQTIGKNSKHTKFVAVRFGNVLGSNGSVIPLFKKQIAEGGPVTVTHKDIIRYFMTIPEAVSLVLQAGAYAKGGQIFVLDMGEPVKIYDLACNLIKSFGYEPNVDIDIVCTGLRPGEKLYEERLMKEEGLQKTPNGLINIARPIELDETAFWTTLEKLRIEVQKETSEMKVLVKELVPTYHIDNREERVRILQKKEDVSKAI